MTHSELWAAICNLADSFNVSCSRLARISGLDPTLFNPSKKVLANGNPRWLSMYSIARVLDATGITLAEFATYLPSDTHERGKYQHFPIKNHSKSSAKKRI